ncbi:MAG: hypothetical protein EZS28_027099 [Streblomastix strix]|uniref:Uncharacterized protein n=1 Tax=Streblomastix strix TaxID=222440 RepID=A0A5J4V5H7_9EUKA|nr:MAG: hypothetical protein EZS28_027099 [Streblomastix strix]
MQLITPGTCTVYTQRPKCWIILYRFLRPDASCGAAFSLLRMNAIEQLSDRIRIIQVPFARSVFRKIEGLKKRPIFPSDYWTISIPPFSKGPMQLELLPFSLPESLPSPG